MQRRDVDIYFSDVKKQLEEKLSKASEILTSIEQKLNETETNRQQSANSLATLNDSYNSAINLINQTRDDLSKVSELRTIALDPESGIESLLAKVTANFEQAEKLASRIAVFTQEAKSQTESIKIDKKTSSENLSQIEKLNLKAEGLLVELEKTYQLAVNTGLSGSFDKRKKEIHEQFVNMWGRRFSYSFAVLGAIAGLVVLISFTVSRFSLEWLTMFRLALISPLLVYVGYAGVQYGKERRFLEKYAFKAAVAASLESHIEILLKHFGGDEMRKDILKFVIDSMNIVYSEPNEEIKKRKVGFSMGNRFGELKSEIIEEVTQKVAEKLKQTE